MRTLVFVALIATSTAALADARDISKVNGAIHATTGSDYGDLETVNGAIKIDPGVVADEVETVNGSITIGDGAKVESVEVVNGRIEIGANVMIADGVETVNGRVTIGTGSRIGKQVETVNGGIELHGASVGGNIETVGGDVLIGTNSVVKGKLIIYAPTGAWFSTGNARKPRVVIEAGAVVEGGLDFRREVELVRDPAATIGTSSSVER